MRRAKKIGWGKNSVHLRRPKFAGPSRQQVLDQRRERLQEEDVSNTEVNQWGGSYDSSTLRYAALAPTAM